MREGARHDADPSLFTQRRTVLSKKDRIGGAVQDIAKTGRGISKERPVGDLSRVAVDRHDRCRPRVNVGEDFARRRRATFTPATLLPVACDIVTATDSDLTTIDDQRVAGLVANAKRCVAACGARTEKRG